MSQMQGGVGPVGTAPKAASSRELQWLWRLTPGALGLAALSPEQVEELRAAALVHVFMEAARVANPRLRDESWAAGSEKWQAKKVLVPLSELALPPSLAGSGEGGSGSGSSVIGALLQQPCSTLALYRPKVPDPEKQQQQQQQVQLHGSFMQIVAGHKLLESIATGIALRVQQQQEQQAPVPFQTVVDGLQPIDQVYVRVSERALAHRTFFGQRVVSKMLSK